MKLTDYAAQIALSNGGFLMAGDCLSNIKAGEVITVDGREALAVERLDCVTLMDAPLDMVLATCRERTDRYMPFYGDMAFELPHQAAMAQMLNDAGKGFDLDDLLSIEALDATVIVVHVKPWSRA